MKEYSKVGQVYCCCKWGHFILGSGVLNKKIKTEEIKKLESRKQTETNSCPEPDREAKKWKYCVIQHSPTAIETIALVCSPFSFLPFVILGAIPYCAADSQARACHPINPPPGLDSYRIEPDTFQTNPSGKMVWQECCVLFCWQV